LSFELRQKEKALPGTQVPGRAFEAVVGIVKQSHHCFWACRKTVPGWAATTATTSHHGLHGGSERGM